MHLPGGVEGHPVEEEYSRLPSEVTTHLEVPAMPVLTVDKKDTLPTTAHTIRTAQEQPISST